MKRLLVLFFATLFAEPAIASEFSSYEEYETLLNMKMKNREFSNVLRDMGGDDEYTEQQLARIQSQMLGAVPYYLTNVDIIKRVELQNGFSQELRAYWNDRNSYIYFYALLHERDDDLLVILFAFNTNPKELLAKF